MKRKMLITLVFAIVVTMLFSCIAPILQVQAASAKTTMSFNTALYKAVKSYFQEKGISASFNDGLHTIKVDNDVLAGIEELSLKEKGITDLTGLTYFTGLKRLILSGNDLDNDSNLEILNRTNFPNLSYLDLSSNQISNVSGFQELLEYLISLDSNAVNITGQNVKIIEDIELGETDDSIKVDAHLPQILQFAGIADATQNDHIKNDGILKSEWIEEYRICSRASRIAPYISNELGETIPNEVTEEDDSFKIIVGNVDESDIYTQYQGLLKVVINIKDRTFSSYDINPASENILKDSIFTLYYVVHSANLEGVIFKDGNFYSAVKEQLSMDQIINNDLISYKYSVNEDGEKYYDYCDIELDGTTATLSINGVDEYVITKFNQYGYNEPAVVNKVTSTFDDGRWSSYIRYEVQDYEIEYVDELSSTGVVTRTLKVKVPHYNEDARDLFVDNYDEPYVLVISDSDLINKISSLILNDKRIVYLDGLEKFVGLESKLNVSYNYIKTLKNLFELQENKEYNNSILQNLYSEKVNAMNSKKEIVKTSYNTIEDTIQSIKDEITNIENLIAEANALDSSAEGYAQKINEIISKINEINNKIKGDGTSQNQGMTKSLDDAMSLLNDNLSKLYDRLETMYKVYNKEYKLTTLLIPELNYETEEEYYSLQDKMSTKEGAKQLVTAEFSRLATFESAEALSDLDKDLIISALGLNINPESKTPISDALNEYLTDLNDSDAGRVTYTRIINSLLEVNLYSQAASYCLLERMNNSTASLECYVLDFFAKKIKEYEIEGINTDLVVALYESQKNGTSSLSYNRGLYTIFVNYKNDFQNCYNGTAYYCKGDYDFVDELIYNVWDTTATLGTSSVTYTSAIQLGERLENAGNVIGGMYFYNQLMTLANKFTAVNEISRYVVLPTLKSIDVRNNEIENLYVTFGDDRLDITNLTNLKEFYAGHNIITGDISSTDWSNAKNLKKLDLSYNYITDISPLQVLTNLNYLDVSDNLLGGEFNLRLNRMPRLKNIILAGNQYTDISRILVDYEMVSNGNFSEYFSREDTINIDLSRQELEVNVEEPISYDRNVRVYEVQLPPIFAQLEYIDAERTAYGITSSKGTITASGGCAYVPVTSTGDFAGIVKVIAANGYPEDVSTSFGIDTTCTITYSVRNINVDSVTINTDNNSRVEAGTSRTFTATVNGENVPDSTVEWDIVSEHSAGTTITDEGVLTVDPNEEATEITIEATSNYNDEISATATLQVYRRTITDIQMNGPESILVGKTGEYTVIVNGENLEDDDKNVSWSVLGNTSENTKIEEQEGKAILTVSNDENSENITVVARSTFDESKSASKSVTVSKKVVTGVTVSGESEIKVGKTSTYTAIVNGENLEDGDKSVTWSISGNTSNNTKIENTENANEAKLTVASDETAETITVTATSEFDTDKVGTVSVTIKTNASGLPANLGYNIDDDNDITGVSPDTTVSTFKSTFVTDNTYTVKVTRNGSELANTALVGTGDIVSILKNGSVISSNELVVKGDVNGDGTISEADSKLVKAHRAKITTLTDVAFKAADVDNDNEITISDVRLILAHRARIPGYTL